MDLEEARTKTRGEEEEEEEEEGRQHKKRRRMMEEETKPEEEKEEIKRREEEEEDNSARMKEVEEVEKRMKEEEEKVKNEEEEGKEENKRKANKGEKKNIGKKEKTQENEEKMEKEEEDTQTHAHTPPDHTDTKQTSPAPTNAQTLSKRQLKKQLKRARWLETKEARKKHKRQREKEKAKERRLQHTPEKSPQLSLGLENSPEPSDVPNSSPSALKTLRCNQDPKVAQNLASPAQADPNLAPAPPASYTPPVSRRSLKKHSVKMSASPCKLRVAVDLSLAALMNDRRLGQCLRQVARCYSANRRVPAPLQLYVTSFTGRAKSIMSQQAGYENWDVHFQTESYLSEFRQSDIIYLTSESTHTLQTLDQTKVYIIGGLVDHNKLKGHCYELAKDHKLATARLPLDRYLDMRTRKVLTIDQVFRILLGVAGGGRWREVLLSVLPARKGAKGKEEGEEEEEEKGDDVEDVEVKREKPKEEEEEEEKGNDIQNENMKKEKEGKEEEKGNDIQNENMKREKKEGKEEEEVDHILLK
ncbi:tRNA methyltransferase 10 homolog A-like [Eriocheir sinensis]|uniref:tRNA methyltransferase 10 homolog A-like n=1 Tax=Eriocheir sinensis TaxID=95602 RepID=UPI0021C7CFE3|nr:tRNA methyltransferase 10 homolog A-like [Eriocheir sinensis]XP_050731347.1 tRNA methyltransferase 10 homolog A-like [Eriocheir sinensis]